MGDPSGIGPEVLVKSLARVGQSARGPFLVIGDHFVLSKIIKDLRLRLAVNRIKDVSAPSLKKGAVNLLDLENVSPGGFSYGKDHPRYGKAALEYIDRAVALLTSGASDALVTAPVNKSTIARAGAEFVGHTEYLARKAGVRKFAMMLIGGDLRVVLVTRHVPLKDVPGNLSEDAISDTIGLTYEALRTQFGIRAPRIGVAGLNPHAGDAGKFGHEEEDIIRPAVERSSRTIPGITGPRPPDVIFYEAYHKRYDAVVAMYHDQGLIPLKMLYFEEGVNCTLGLPFVRTSPDHGTAFDIAGRGIANPRSMQEAMRTASALSAG